jgi:hypothetical protein
LWIDETDLPDNSTTPADSSSTQTDIATETPEQQWEQS